MYTGDTHYYWMPPTPWSANFISQFLEKLLKNGTIQIEFWLKQEKSPLRMRCGTGTWKFKNKNSERNTKKRHTKLYEFEKIIETAQYLLCDEIFSESLLHHGRLLLDNMEIE